MNEQKNTELKRTAFYGKAVFENPVAEKGLSLGNMCCHLDETGKTWKCAHLLENEKYEKELTEHFEDKELVLRQMRIDAIEAMRKSVVDTQGKLVLAPEEPCPIALVHTVLAVNGSINCGVSRCPFFSSGR